MLFACNYSNELVEILEDNSFICDYIKIGDFGPTKKHIKDVIKMKPLLIHGFGWFERGGMPDAKTMDYQYMNKQLKEAKTPFLGMHIMAYPTDVSESKDLVKHMASIFTDVSKNLDCELILENMDYSPHYTYDSTIIEAVKPEFISRVIDKTNLKMLLDTSHALVSAYQLNMDIYDYLEALPLEKIREIHFSGSFCDDKKGFLDIHGIMTKLDYEIATYLSNHPRIKNSGNLKMITLEYGNHLEADKFAIVDQLYKLKKIFKDI